MSEKAKFTRIYDDGESVCVEGRASGFSVKAQDIYEWKTDERANRRAQFACAAMQGLLASTTGPGTWTHDSIVFYVNLAVEAADEAVAALEKAP